MGKTQIAKDRSGLIKLPGDPFRYMGIGSDRDQFAAHFPVARKNFRQRVKIAHAFYQRGSIDFQRNAAGDEFAQDGVDQACECFICVELLSVRKIARHIIQVAARINIGIGPYIRKRVLKIEGERFFFCAVLKKVGVVGVVSRAQMVGSYDKIEVRMGGKIVLEKGAEMRLQADLDSEAKLDPALIFLFHFKKLFSIRNIVKLKCTGCRIRYIFIWEIGIVVIRKAHMRQTAADSGQNLSLHRRCAVA